MTGAGDPRPRRGGGRRHRGRELALRVLFELEGTTRDPETALLYQADDLGATADVAAHARRLVDDVLRHSAVVDGAIGAASENWALADLGKVERAVLRIATAELLLEDDVPVGVAIDEAIELARTYAGDEAAPFVNGVLSRVAAERPAARP